MKELLNYLFQYNTLAKEQAKEVLINIAQGKYNNSEIAAFLAVYMMRSITVEELTGFRDALLELCHRVDFSGYDTIDMCGTGGDGKDTFNISTLASVVVAGAGFKVAKHGNYGVSSVCGSSNVLEYLGYHFANDSRQLEKELDKAGICFLHAPLFHPAMKMVGPVRKELGVKTFFNMLGPLVNPSFPKYQSVGVFNLELARLYNYLLQQSDKSFTVLHSLDGYDEISLTGAFKSISKEKEQVLQAADLGLEQCKAEELHGGNSVKEAADIFMKILDGEGTAAQNNVVCANAALAISCFRPDDALEDLVDMAKESLLSGKAKKSLTQILN